MKHIIDLSDIEIEALNYFLKKKYDGHQPEDEKAKALFKTVERERHKRSMEHYFKRDAIVTKLTKEGLSALGIEE